jgi:hypothetical protein
MLPKWNCARTSLSMLRRRIYVRPERSLFPACTSASVHALIIAVGRTALHVAASCGALKSLEWLIDRYPTLLNASDSENRWSVLHRAVYFGKVVVGLIFRASRVRSHGIFILFHLKVFSLQHFFRPGPSASMHPDARKRKRLTPRSRA